MESAVSMVLTAVLWPFYSMGRLETAELWQAFKRGEARSLAGTGPHNRRNPWRPEATKLYLVSSGDQC